MGEHDGHLQSSFEPFRRGVENLNSVSAGIRHLYACQYLSGSVGAPSALGDGHRVCSIIQQLRLLINPDIMTPGVLLESRFQRARHGAFAELFDGYMSSASSRLVVTACQVQTDERPRRCFASFPLDFTFRPTPLAMAEMLRLGRRFGRIPDVCRG